MSKKHAMIQRTLGSLTLFFSALPAGAQTVSARQANATESFVAGELLVCAVAGKETLLAGSIGSSGLTILERDTSSGVFRVGIPAG